MQGNRLIDLYLVFSKLPNDAGYICKKIISKFQHSVRNGILLAEVSLGFLICYSEHLFSHFATEKKSIAITLIRTMYL
jgi:hypothetical protein